jgi:hypothetical protein
MKRVIEWIVPWQSLHHLPISVHKTLVALHLHKPTGREGRIKKPSLMPMLTVERAYLYELCHEASITYE